MILTSFCLFLLVWVLYEALVFGSKARHNRIVSFVHCLFLKLCTFSFWEDWFVNGEAKSMPYREMPVLSTRHNVEGTIDGKWTYW